MYEQTKVNQGSGSLSLLERGRNSLTEDHPVCCDLRIERHGMGASVLRKGFVGRRGLSQPPRGMVSAVPAAGFTSLRSQRAC